MATFGVSAAEDVDDRGGGHQRALACVHFPEISRHLGHCPPLNTSAGVAKGDFNGDGFADLAVGVPNEGIVVNRAGPGGTPVPTNISGAGAVVIIYGSTDGLTAAATAPVASQLWHQAVAGIPDDVETNDRFGAALAAGDFNGDDFSDLAISVPGDNAVHVLRGSSGGLVANEQMIVGTQFNDGDGFALTLRPGLAWGDFDGDGIGDLVIEAREPGTGVLNVPNVVVLYGSTQFGPQFVGLDVIEFTNGGSAGELPDQSVEISVTSGDFDGDGADDLAVGLPLADIPVTGGTALDAGTVTILKGSTVPGPGTARGLSTAGATGLTQESAQQTSETLDQFGATLAAGDFNGDGFVDLAVGAPLEDRGSVTNEGMVSIFLGASTFQTTLTQSGFGQPRDFDDNFGAALAAGDFNGDGVKDLAIGVPGDRLPTGTSSIDAAGSVSVIYGGVASNGLAAGNGPGIQLFTETIISGSSSSEAGDNFGATLTAWNFGKTTHADLAIGVPGEDILVRSGGTFPNLQFETRADVGHVRAIYGSGTGLTTTGAQVWGQNSSGVPDSEEAGDRFGSALY